MISLCWNENIIGSKNKIIEIYNNKLKNIKLNLINKKCQGSDFLEWLNFPNKNFYQFDDKNIMEIKSFWKKMKIKHVIYIGIGGSYIGARAAIEMNSLKYEDKIKFHFISNLDQNDIFSLLNFLEDKNWSIIVVSKSGTTFETAVNFKIFRNALHNKYGKEYYLRVAAITDLNSGILNNITKKEKFWKLSIPNGIGGRYSSLTSISLLPLALLDLDYYVALKGWNDVINNFKNNDEHCDAFIYAAIRNEMLNKFNKNVEVFNTYENSLRYIGEHYKQIFAESEGKKIPSIIPTIANYSQDLHSIGQLYQSGSNAFFETSLICLNNVNKTFLLKSVFLNDDNLDNFNGKTVKELNEIIELAVWRSRINHIPNIKISFEGDNLYCFGSIMAFFALSAAGSALLNNVNPFDQPGVEVYKTEMKNIINK
ncbi:MAG: hypothetical protein ACRCW6_02530 [Mycoplasmoidaceae bacterium]